MTKVDPTFVVEVVIGAILLLFGLALVLFGGGDDNGMRRLGVKVLAVTVIIGGVLLWPFDMDYHEYTLKAGVVATDPVPRMIGSGGSTSQVYPVAIEGVGVYRCDDTRCALLHKGDQVAMWCIREYQWASTSGWTCRFKSSTEAPEGS